MKLLSKIFRLLLWFVFWLATSLVVLFLTLVVLFQIPSVQNYAAQKAVNYLSETWETEVSLKSLSLTFSGKVKIDGFYLEDTEENVLWQSKSIFIGISPAALLNKHIKITDVEIDKGRANILRKAPDFHYNFAFITGIDTADEEKTREEPETDTTSAPWKFSLNRIAINDLKLNLIDERDGMHLSTNIGRLRTNLGKSDFSVPEFNIPLIDLKNSHIAYKGFPPKGEAPPVDDEPGEFPNIHIDRLNLSSFSLRYDDHPGAYGFDVSLPEADFQIYEPDIEILKFDLKKATLKSPYFAYRSWEKAPFPALPESVQRKKKQTQETTEPPEHPPFTLLADEIDLRSGRFTYNDYRYEKIDVDYIDYSHIDFFDLNLSATEVDWEWTDAIASIHELSGKERSGFVLEILEGELEMDNNQAEIDQLNLKTSRSHIQDYLKISYPRLSSFVDDYMALDYNFNINESHIDLKDIFYFAPLLKDDPFVDHLANKRILAEGHITGTMDDLKFEDLMIRTGVMTAIQGSGNFRGLPELDDPYISFPEFKIRSGSVDIPFLIPDDILTDDIAFPSRFAINGSYDGTFEEFTTTINLNSSDGNAGLNATVNFAENPDETSYKGSFSTTKLHIGRIARMEDMTGRATTNFVFDGKGMDIENIEGFIDGEISAIEILDYNYQNFYINTNYQDGTATGEIRADDPNLNFVLNGEGNFMGDVPRLNAELDLKKFYMQPLGLTTEDQKIEGKITANMEGDEIDNLHGNVILNDFRFLSPTLIYPLDSAVFEANTKGELTKYSFDSDFATATFEGNFALSLLPAEIEKHINEYIEIPGYEETEGIEDQKFDFSVSITETLLLTDFFMPELNAEAPITISGNYESQTSSFNMNAYAPYIAYAGTELDSIAINAGSNRQRLEYSLNIRDLNYDVVNISRVGLDGEFRDNRIESYLTLHDSIYAPRHQLGALLSIEDDLFRVSLIEESLLMNYEDWTVDADNYILAGTDEFWIDNLNLSGERGNIKLQSRRETSPAREVLEADIENIEIAYLLSLLQVEEDFAGGTLAAKAKITNPIELDGFSVDASLKDVHFQGHEAGNFIVKANKEVDEEKIDFGLDYQSLQQTRATLDGDYTPDDADGLWNLHFHSEEIILDDFTGLVKPHLTRFGGLVSADVKFEGSPSEPHFDGFIEFENTSFSTPYTRVLWKMQKERINFNQDQIAFPGFSIKDSLDNGVTFDGDIQIADITNPVFNLNFNADNWLVLNTGRRDNRYFYGQLFMNSQASIRGPVMEPEITGSLTFREGTDLFAEIPQYEPDAVDYKGIVEFTNWKNEDEIPIVIEDEPVTVFFKGMEADLTININRQTRVTVLVDPAAGDFLRLQGGGSINASIDPAGNLSLAGEYRIMDGSYQLTFYDVVRRQFEIRPGSNIIWSGDPLEAQLDISAIYNQRTSPEGLFPQQTSGTEYRQPVPFQVYLNMRGMLADPEISFMLDMPEEHRGAAGGTIYSRVNQINENESERNKQVFALLVLNRFIPDNPLESPSTGGGISGGARSSASRLLTQQLNQLSDRFIRGVDLSFDVESYEGMGQEGVEGRTELQMEISRQFLEDRMEIKIGGQMDLEGERRRNSDLNDFAGDVSIEYKLTEDGRLRLKGFREQNYENILDGEYVETGVSIRFGRDFQRFGELFRRSKKDQPEPEEEDENGG